MATADQGDVDKLLRALANVDEWLKRLDPEAPKNRPASRSPLAEDDRRVHPYRTSDAAWHALSHAVDHLHCLRTLVGDAEMLHMYAPYTLIRAALENAAAAVWLLGPANRRERITRRLRLAALDMRSAAHITEALGGTLPRTLDDRLGDLRRIAVDQAIPEREGISRVTYEEVVRGAGAIASQGADLPIIAWRACSGIAHGDLWATLNVTDRAVLPTEVPDVAGLRIQADTEKVQLFAFSAIGLTIDGWRLYDTRSAALLT